MFPIKAQKLVTTTLSTNFREATRIAEDVIPAPGPGELVVKNRVAGVNATDVNITAGHYSPGVKPPFDTGLESTGEVVAVGPDVSGFHTGDYVASSLLGHGYREYHTLEAHRAFRINVPSAEILGILVSGVTASVALEQALRMTSGETVLVTAAAGGTGHFAVQLAKLAGNTVIGTCGTAAKAAVLKSLGCDRIINYRVENLGAVLKNEFPKGADIVYECVGGEVFDTCVQNLAQRGRLAVIGYISEYAKGPQPVTARRIYARLLVKSAAVCGFMLPHYREHTKAHFARLRDLHEAGTLRSLVDPTPFVGLEQIADAVEYLHRGQNLGKVVVRFA